MPRVSPWDDKFSRPAPIQEARAFTLPSGDSLEFTFRELDELTASQALDRARRYVRDYVGEEGGEPPLKLALPDGTAAAMSDHLCMNIAHLQQMEVAPENELPYSLVDWIGLALRCRETFHEVLQFSEQVGRKRDDAGNAPGAAITTTS